MLQPGIAFTWRHGDTHLTYQRVMSPDSPPSHSTDILCFLPSHCQGCKCQWSCGRGNFSIWLVLQRGTSLQTLFVESGVFKCFKQLNRYHQKCKLFLHSFTKHVSCLEKVEKAFQRVIPSLSEVKPLTPCRIVSFFFSSFYRNITLQRNLEDAEYLPCFLSHTSCMDFVWNNWERISEL